MIDEACRARTQYEHDTRERKALTVYSTNHTLSEEKKSRMATHATGERLERKGRDKTKLVKSEIVKVSEKKGARRRTLP